MKALIVKIIIAVKTFMLDSVVSAYQLLFH